MHAGVDFRSISRTNAESTAIRIEPQKDNKWEGLENFNLNITYEDSGREYHLFRTIYIIDIDSKCSCTFVNGFSFSLCMILG